MSNLFSPLVRCADEGEEARVAPFPREAGLFLLQRDFEQSQGFIDVAADGFNLIWGLHLAGAAGR